MVDVADAPQGLRASLAALDAPPAVVLLLAGTFDLEGNCWWESTVDSVLQLHAIAYEEGVPHTVVIGIPQSRKQIEQPYYAEMAQNINRELQEWAAAEDRATFFSFPFYYQGPTDSNYAADGIHMSAQGYQLLAENLAPIVDGILGSGAPMAVATPMPSQEVRMATLAPSAKATTPSPTTGNAERNGVLGAATGSLFGDPSSATPAPTPSPTPMPSRPPWPLPTRTPASQPQDSRTFHIYAYGDSLTKGQSEDSTGNFIPYAPILESVIQESGFPNARVMHRGNQGWTAQEMWWYAFEEAGVATAVRAISNPSVSIVILLAGSMDLWSKTPDEIESYVKEIHDVCFREGVRHTIAVEIPQSQWQHSDPDNLSKATASNTKIKQWAESDSRATWFSFPFAYTGENDPNYASDGFHLSPAGYEALGRTLAPVVADILASIPPEEPVNQRPYNVYAYGDSLTTGQTESSAGPFTPYAPFLEAALQNGKYSNAAVPHMGNQGWRAEEMWWYAYEARGVATGIRNISSPPVSLVILLAGTNDLWTKSAESIEESVRQVHRICFQENNVQRTIAVEIPESKWQWSNPANIAKAKDANQRIKSWADSDARVTWFPFPFQYTGDGDPHFASDGLHFSPLGYKVLGESLAPVVEAILDQV